MAAHWQQEPTASIHCIESHALVSQSCTVAAAFLLGCWAIVGRQVTPQHSNLLHMLNRFVTDMLCHSHVYYVSCRLVENLGLKPWWMQPTLEAPKQEQQEGTLLPLPRYTSKRVPRNPDASAKAAQLLASGEAIQPPTHIEHVS
jgi:hypothetical protein